MDDAERMRRAYRFAARVARDEIARDAPREAAALEDVEASDILVVPGAYDRVQLVLQALALPFTEVSPDQVPALRLRPEQLLVVNCPGELPRAASTRIRAFVEEGGSLFTTDWALRHVLERAFPGTVVYNRRPTLDDVVRIEICDDANPFLRGVVDPDQDPVWWLEGSSYPIRVVSPEVRVLIASSELEQRYGEAPVAVLFSWGEGEVFHMISHYYLQRTELRGDRDRLSAAEYAAARGIEADAEFADLAAGEVETARSSAVLFCKVVARMKQQQGGE